MASTWVRMKKNGLILHFWVNSFCLFVLDVPTKSPPQDDAIGTNEVKVPFVNKNTLSNGKQVK